MNYEIFKDCLTPEEKMALKQTLEKANEKPKVSKVGKVATKMKRTRKGMKRRLRECRAAAKASADDKHGPVACDTMVVEDIVSCVGDQSCVIDRRTGTTQVS